MGVDKRRNAIETQARSVTMRTQRESIYFFVCLFLSIRTLESDLAPARVSRFSLWPRVSRSGLDLLSYLPFLL